MRVLVTGGTGAIGRFVLDELLRQGHLPVLCTRGGVDGLPPWVPTDVEVFMGDISDRDGIADILKRAGAERVLHLAAAVGGGVDDHIRVNGLGTFNVLRAARRAGVQRVVLMSSKAVYGDISAEHGPPRNVPLTEEHQLRPLGAYGASKLLAENFADSARHRWGIEIVKLRASTTVGPGKGFQHGASACTSELIENPASGRAVHIPNGADQVDDFIYTKDVARALALACLVESLPHDTYHVSTNRGVTLGDIAEVVRALRPDVAITLENGGDFFGADHNQHALLDNSRIRQDLGFKVQFPFPNWVEDYFADVAKSPP
jgi:nucleoside-diphosphate-sugar epimerase